MKNSNCSLALLKLSFNFEDFNFKFRACLKIKLNLCWPGSVHHNRYMVLWIECRWPDLPRHPGLWFEFYFHDYVGFCLLKGIVVRWVVAQILLHHHHVLSTAWSPDTSRQEISWLNYHNGRLHDISFSFFFRKWVTVQQEMSKQINFPSCRTKFATIVFNQGTLHFKKINNQPWNYWRDWGPKFSAKLFEVRPLYFSVVLLYLILTTPLFL